MKGKGEIMRSKLFMGIIVSLLLASMLTVAFNVAPTACSESGSVGYWKVDEGSGTTAYATDQETNLDIRPMVFVHGFSGSGAQFESQAMRFTSNGYPANYIATYEYDSYGLYLNASLISQVLAGLNNSIATLRTQTGFDQVNLIGHSMGTMVCQRYLNNSGDAAKIANYVNIDGATATSLPGGVPTLAIWAGTGWTYDPSNNITGATNVWIPSTTHVEVCTCAESFAYMYEFFTGEEPVTTDIVPQLLGQVVLAGRALYFSVNIPVQNATLEIWEVNGDTGARNGSSPQATYDFPSQGNGTWGPFDAKGGVPYEFALTLSDGKTVHYYHQPIIRNDSWIRLLTDQPGGLGLAEYMDTWKSPTHSNLIIIRYKEFWGDQGPNNDILAINGTNIINANTCPMNKMGAVNAIYAFDKGNDTVSHVDTPISFYAGMPFMTGVDLYIPAAIPPNGTISLVLMPRGSIGKTQVINVPNWASLNQYIIVQFNDYGPSPSVGGIWVPVDKLALLVPYVALVSTILVATAATAIYVKRRKKRQ
jgi:pimeloyl-ACP methyl ester carboxylesterase